MDNTVTTTDTQPITEPKTSTDAEIETLKKQFADMQARYEKTISDYQTENRKLYAHAVGIDNADTEDSKSTFDYDKATDVCFKYLGLKG